MSLATLGTMTAGRLGAMAPESPHVLLTDPYLQAPGEDSITICWISALPSLGWVEYGEEQPEHKAYASKNGLIVANNRIHAITLHGLKPGKKYFYRVHARQMIKYSPWKAEYGDTVQSPVFQFTLPSGQASRVEMAILNDIHDRPASIPHLLGLDKSPVDYVFLNGDMFNVVSTEQQLIDHLIKPSTAAYATGIPMLFGKGNHEERGSMARELDKYFVNQPPNRPFYCQRFGPVCAVMLDSGEDNEDFNKGYAGLADFEHYLEEQRIWLETIVKTPAFKSAPFRVVFVHIPPYHTHKERRGNMRCRALFSPVFEKSKVDLVISGHTHTYGIHPPDEQHKYPLIIGGGPKDGERTLMRLSASEKELSVRLISDNGQQVGKYTVKRKRG